MSDIETLDLASENQRLRELVEELERTHAETHSLLCSGEVLREDFKMRWINAMGDVSKAEAERDAALSQVAVLREAMRPIIDALNSHHTAECDDGNSDNCVACGGDDVAEVADRIAQAAQSALASTLVPTHDYSGLCAAPSCKGHCGYVHARGCEAVREYLADHGGEPYRAPSKAVTP